MTELLPLHNLQTCRRGRYTDDLSPTATHQTNTNPPSPALRLSLPSSTSQLANTTKGRGGIRFAHCRLLIMARRASCTRSSGARHGFLPSILEKVAAPSQHGHISASASSLHRCIVAFHSAFFVLFACSMLCICPHSDPPAPAAPWLRRSKQQAAQHRAQGAE
jgi:hypothetical protein